MPLEATNTSPANEVPAEAAYVAAADRALRTTRALIESEARTVDLQWRLDRALGELQELRAKCQMQARHIEDLEGGPDAQNDEDDGSAAGREADSAHAFSD